MKKRKRRATATPAVQRLRRRLREAEQTLRAIREGNVDALVIDSPDGDQLFTLRSADQPYRLMVEQMREGALTLSATGTILYCNEHFAHMIGASAQAMTTRNLGDYVAVVDQDKYRHMLEASASRDAFALVNARGESHPTQISSTSLSIDGVRTVAVVISDVTHEQVERGLRESNRLKDEFLATLSHELRTPLNVILGWTRMLLAGQLSEVAARRALGLIDRNAQAQVQLVNDLVDMSRMTTGKLTLSVEDLPVEPLLEAALESVRPAAHAKNLTLRLVRQSEAMSVRADATRLQQVLWNLLSNAVKFTPQGGKISLSARMVGGRMRIEVADTGIGIDRTFLPHVFDRFRQADSATTRAYGGLGLGLAIVRDLVRLHGGDVEVRSDGLGQGSAFSVTLNAGTSATTSSNRRAVRETRGVWLDIESWSSKITPTVAN